MLVAAEFGGGKSHVLEYLSHRARGQNFAVSKVVISKETQLFDPLKVFRAAVDSLLSENVVGDALREIAVSRLSPKSPSYDEFSLWLHGSGLNSRFEATTWLYEQAEEDNELQDELVSFWEGGSIEVTYLRRKLRECGGAKFFALEKTAAKELARQRFVFMSRLLCAARYDGWVILLDELELMGRYTVLQRGRAYAELARLLGLLDDSVIPGLLTVGAITPDYESAILVEKGDIDQIGFRFRARGDLESALTAARAETAMEEIKRSLLRISEPSEQDLARVHDTLLKVYATAYGCEPAPLPISYKADKQMRHYVRSWITTWDLNRVDPDYQPDIEAESTSDDYLEDALLEKSSEDDVPGHAGDVGDAS
jgi:hypothetical protein